MNNKDFLQFTLPPVVLLAFLFALLSSYCQPIPEPIIHSPIFHPFIPNYNLSCYVNNAGATEQPEIQFPWQTAAGRLLTPMSVSTTGTIASGVSLSSIPSREIEI